VACDCREMYPLWRPSNKYRVFSRLSTRRCKMKGKSVKLYVPATTHASVHDGSLHWFSTLVCTIDHKNDLQEEHEKLDHLWDLCSFSMVYTHHVPPSEQPCICSITSKTEAVQWMSRTTEEESHCHLLLNLESRGSMVIMILV